MDDPTDMDLGHDDLTGEIRGWEHGHCNRSAGAHKLNALNRLGRGRPLTAAQRAALGGPADTPAAVTAGAPRRRLEGAPDGRPEDYVLNHVGELYEGGQWWRWADDHWARGTGCSRIW